MKTVKAGWTLATLMAAMVAATPVLAQTSGSAGASVSGSASTQTGPVTSSSGAAVSSGTGATVTPGAGGGTTTVVTPSAQTATVVTPSGNTVMGAAPSSRTTTVVTRAWVNVPAGVEGDPSFQRWLRLK